MKKRLLALLGKKEEKKQALVKRAQESEDVKELRGINEELETLNNEIAEMRSMIDSLPDEPENDEGFIPNEPQQRSAQQQQFNPMGTYILGGAGGAQQRAAITDDIYSTVEYRSAFMNYVTKGTPIPEQYQPTEEMRADALTVTTDVTAVIPTNIMNKVIEELTTEGRVLRRVFQTAFKGGIDIPISEIKPTAHWITEDTPSERQKAEMKNKITFRYHMLECKVAIGLLTSIVSLPVFERTVIKAIKKAMIKAVEDAIVDGDGSGKPTGILTYTLPADRVITFTADNISKVDKWAEVEAAIPLAYETGGIYIMSKKTWEKHLNGATDNNGQKIGLGKINEKGTRVLNGREVLLVDNLPSFDAASVDDIFGIVVDLEDYLLNSNLTMAYKKYWDEDKNQWVHKALMIVDGQMCETRGMVYLKK